MLSISALVSHIYFLSTSWTNIYLTERYQCPLLYELHKWDYSTWKFWPQLWNLFLYGHKEIKIIRTTGPQLVLTNKIKIIRTTGPQLVLTNKIKIIRTTGPQLVLTNKIKIIRTTGSQLVLTNKTHIYYGFIYFPG